MVRVSCVNPGIFCAHNLADIIDDETDRKLVALDPWQDQIEAVEADSDLDVGKLSLENKETSSRTLPHHLLCLLFWQLLIFNRNVHNIMGCALLGLWWNIFELGSQSIQEPSKLPRVQYFVGLSLSICL